MLLHLLVNVPDLQQERLPDDTDTGSSAPLLLIAVKYWAAVHGQQPCMPV